VFSGLRTAKSNFKILYNTVLTKNGRQNDLISRMLFFEFTKSWWTKLLSQVLGGPIAPTVTPWIRSCKSIQC